MLKYGENHGANDAFSVPHTLAYTLQATIEANMNIKYNALYWQTACLSINSGSVEVEVDAKKKSTDYGKIAESIGKMKSHGVNIAQPLINQAEFGFIPDIPNDRIIFSLKGIVGVGDEVAYSILENRPYASFEDFYERMYLGKLVQKKHVVQLIKAGAFNDFGEARQVMKSFVMKEIGWKESLNMQNMKQMISMGLLRGELKKYEEMFNFREHIVKKVVRTEEVVSKRAGAKPKQVKIFSLDEHSQKFYEAHFDGSSVVGFGEGLELSEVLFKKEYDAIMDEFKEIINKEDFIKDYNLTLFKSEWFKVAKGSVSKWEMDSISYYEHEHELANVNTEKYNIINFFDLDEAPVVYDYTYYKDKKIPKNKIFTIMGTVLDKNPSKSTISVLTPDGVVTVKTYKGSFAHYNRQVSRKISADKKEIVEKSWFSRGNLVLLNGFRRDDDFILKTYKVKGEETQHTVNLIVGVEKNGDLILQSERKSAYE